MKTIVVESFVVCPPIGSDPADTFDLGLFSPKFPRRDGARLIQIAARNISQSFDGLITVDVGRGDHRRSFQFRLERRRLPVLPPLTQAEKETVLSGGIQ
jgi:hypothetical protein